MPINFINPDTDNCLVREKLSLVDTVIGECVAAIVGGIPRFVSNDGNYAESFGIQWNRWESIRSGLRGSTLGLADTIRKRTRFDDFDTIGKSLLECGMGGGDDTEVLLEYGFSEVHSFDISTSVNRASKFLNDPRLTISQASIFEIPYPDNAFDFVYCHRVLQHTPNPEKALRCICNKVKPGGVLFAHAYKRSWRHMAEWRYKFRWLTKRLPNTWILRYVDVCGRLFHKINATLYPIFGLGFLAYNFIPFYHKTGMDDCQQTLELEKLITFDALTPKYDQPMRNSVFRSIIEEEGFEIYNYHDPLVSPLWCTAIKRNIEIDKTYSIGKENGKKKE